MTSVSKKIFCPSCRQESAVKVVKKYDGFTLVGEIDTCAFCGYEFNEEEPEVIRDSPPGWVNDKELKKVCHRCQNYVINPFIQKCVLHQREVEATDTCEDFSLSPAPEKETEPKGDPPPPPSILGSPIPPPRL
jgi:rubredoxin